MSGSSVTSPSSVKRSKTLPFGGRLDGEELKRVREQLRLAVRFASIEQQTTFDPHARERWIAAYNELSRGEAGLAGAATARAEAHTVRLALLYALLDCSDMIRLEHLEAALALWNYSAASARWVFGDSIGDPTADEIWSLARERHDGITRTEVSNLFSRNKKAREIDRALQAPIDAGRLERATMGGATHRPRPHSLAARQRSTRNRPRGLRELHPVSAARQLDYRPQLVARGDGPARRATPISPKQQSVRRASGPVVLAPQRVATNAQIASRPPQHATEKR
jgi:hypothetical protein